MAAVGVLTPMGSWMQATTFGSRRTSGRVAFAVLAILALSLLPLRALCELGFAQAAQTASAHPTEHGSGDSDPCCTSIDDATLVNSAMPDVSAGKGVTLVVAALASTPIVVGSLVRPFRIPGLPPPPQSYYVRSARILR